MHAEESETMAVITAEASRVRKIRLNGHLQPREEVTCRPDKMVRGVDRGLDLGCWLKPSPRRDWADI